jgi:aspartate/methionine/tyrosine aminotransferase
VKPSFSRRTRWDRSPNPLAAKLEALRHAGADLIDLTESNPTHCGFDYPADLLRALASPPALQYDPDPRGLPDAREAVARHLGRYGGQLGPDELLLCASTSEAYGFLFKLLCDPDDSVLVPRPSYPLFDFLTGFEAVRPSAYALHFDGGWRFDTDEVLRASDGRTRAVLVVSPANPTGHFLKQSELARLSELCARRGWALIVDEVFSDYGFGSDPERVSSVVGRETPALTFVLSGLSKVAALPQLKLAWISVSGPDRAEAMERLELISDAYLSLSTPVQIALPQLLSAAPAKQRQIRERVQANRAALEASRPKDAPWSVLPAEGGWYALIRLPLQPAEEAVASRCLDEGVIVQPGYFYDFPSGAWLVISLLPPADLFATGVKRLVRALAA